jgi:hypothetical protein
MARTDCASGTAADAKTAGGIAASREQDVAHGREVSRELVKFIDRCPSAFHTVAAARALLDEAGATYLPEGEPWRLERGGTYYTVRNNSSIICWHVGAVLDDLHFQVAAAHGDSPSYRVKAGDVVAVGEKARDLLPIKEALISSEHMTVPAWLEVDIEKLRGTVLQLPVRDQIDLISDGTIDPQLIVELYSK